MFLSEIVSLMVGDVTLGLEIALGADEEEHGGGRRERPGVGEPRLEVVEGLAPADVEDEQRAHCSAVVAPRHGPEPLLPRRVPDLQLHTRIAQIHNRRPKLHAYSVL